MIEQAKSQAKRDFAQGLGHNENPYPKNTPERAAWMLEMGRLQLEEFQNDLIELGAMV